MKKRASFVVIVRMLRPECLCSLRFISWNTISKTVVSKGGASEKIVGTGLVPSGGASSGAYLLSVPHEDMLRRWLFTHEM